ncbi:MAG: ATP-binding protein [Bacteroidota bacterium]
MKNALEASPEGETIVISCSKSDDKIEFTVNNQGKIPEEIQFQIFQRSFSTKSKTRGLGTYSVKLLAERFLKGTAGFTTEERRGTTFSVRFPIHVNPVEK